MPLPLVPLLLGSGALLLFFGAAKTAQAAPAAPPRNATGDIPGRDEPPSKKEPTSVAEVFKAAEQAAEIVQKQSVSAARPADQIREIAEELETHLRLNRPGTERPAMVAAFQTPRGLKPDGKYGPVTALDLARVLGRSPPPPRFGTAIAIAKYKADLAKLLGSAQSVSNALAPSTIRTIPWADMGGPEANAAARSAAVAEKG